MKGCEGLRENSRGHLFSDCLAPLFEAAEIGLWKMDASSGRVAFNPYLKQLVGLTQHTESLDLSSLLLMIHRDDAAWMKEIMQACMSGAIDGFKEEHRILGRNDSTLSVMNYCSVSRDENDRPDYLTGILYDISGKKGGRDALRDSGFAAEVTDGQDMRHFIVNSGCHIMPGFAPEDMRGFACHNSRKMAGFEEGG